MLRSRLMREVTTSKDRFVAVLTRHTHTRIRECHDFSHGSHFEMPKTDWTAILPALVPLDRRASESCLTA